MYNASSWCSKSLLKANTSAWNSFLRLSLASCRYSLVVIYLFICSTLSYIGAKKMKWNGNVVSSGLLKMSMVLYRVTKFVKQRTNNKTKQFIFSCSTIIPKIVSLTVQPSCDQVHQNSQQILHVFWFCGYFLLIVLVLTRIFGSIVLQKKMTKYQISFCRNKKAMKQPKQT